MSRSQTLTQKAVCVRVDLAMTLREYEEIHNIISQTTPFPFHSTDHYQYQQVEEGSGDLGPLSHERLERKN